MQNPRSTYRFRIYLLTLVLISVTITAQDKSVGPTKSTTLVTSGSVKTTGAASRPIITIDVTTPSKPTSLKLPEDYEIHVNGLLHQKTTDEQTILEAVPLTIRSSKPQKAEQSKELPLDVTPCNLTGTANSTYCEHPLCEFNSGKVCTHHHDSQNDYCSCDLTMPTNISLETEHGDEQSALQLVNSNPRPVKVDWAISVRNVKQGDEFLRTHGPNTFPANSRTNIAAYSENSQFYIVLKLAVVK